MKTDIGEYIVGAYLALIKKCDVVSYNVRSPGGGLEGLGELDVVGLDFKTKTAYLCEVTTHIRGVLYRDAPNTIEKIKKKHSKQKKYASKYLKDFPKRHFMFWSPVVPSGIMSELRKVKKLEVFANKEYTECIEQLKKLAKATTHDAGNPFFRILQILEHLRKK